MHLALLCLILQLLISNQNRGPNKGEDPCGPEVKLPPAIPPPALGWVSLAPTPLFHEPGSW